MVVKIVTLVSNGLELVVGSGSAGDVTDADEIELFSDSSSKSKITESLWALAVDKKKEIRNKAKTITRRPTSIFHFNPQSPLSAQPRTS